MYSAERGSGVSCRENEMSDCVEMGGRMDYLPRTVRSAGLEEMMAAAKAMVRSLGNLR
jgi:hypothetical protein